MKNRKYMICVMITAMALGLSSCGNTQSDTATKEISVDLGTANTETPETDTQQAATSDTSTEETVDTVDSLDQLNQQTGASFRSPGVMGVTDESYRIYHRADYDVAEYCFSVNDMPYSFLFSTDTAADISGFFADVSDDETYYEDEACKAERSFIGDGQYCLVVYDNGQMEADTFTGIAEELFVVVTME